MSKRGIATIALSCCVLLGMAPAFAQKSLRQFAGTSINLIAESQDSTDAIVAQIPEFEKLTGIKVNVQSAPIDDVIQKEMLALQSGSGDLDVMSTPYQFLGGFVENGYLLSLDKFLADKSTHLVPGFNKDDLIPGMLKASGMWKGSIYGIPSNTCIMLLIYRKDLFQDPGEKAAFKKAYGYELAVPANWKQYQDVATFFTRKAGETLAGAKLQRPFYGTTLQAKRHDSLTCEWLNFAWSFGGGIFDAKGNLVMNSAENVAALDYYKGLMKYSPPGVTNNTWDEVSTQFEQGLVAMAVQWNDNAPPMEDPKQSLVAGKLGYGAIPVGKAPAAHYGAWSYMVPAKTKHPEAAWLFLQWANSKSVQTKMALDGGFPSLASVYADPELLKLPYWAATLEANKISSIRPRIPEWNDMNESMMLELSKVMSGGEGTKAALDALQKKYASLLKGKLPIAYQ